MENEEKALVTQPQSAAGGLMARVNWNDEDKALMRQTVAQNLTEPEFKVFIIGAAIAGLNPMPPNPQIYPVKYKGRMVLQTSIDGYRTIAERKGNYNGVHKMRLRVKTKDGPSITVPHEEYDPEEHVRIISGTVEIHFKDGKTPQESTAVFASYAKWYKNDSGKLYLGENWQNMGDVMILKCAEAQVHRKANPNDFKDLYINEEMDQAKADIDAIDVDFTRMDERPGATGSLPGKAKGRRQPRTQTELPPQKEEETSQSAPEEEENESAPASEEETQAQEIPAPAEQPEPAAETSGPAEQPPPSAARPNPLVKALIPTVFSYLTRSCQLTEDGVEFARKLLCEKFAAKAPEEIPDEDFDMLRFYCRDRKEGLLKILEEKKYIPPVGKE